MVFMGIVWHVFLLLVRKYYHDPAVGATRRVALTEPFQIEARWQGNAW